jgi:hypothetical protein
MEMVRNDFDFWSALSGLTIKTSEIAEAGK